MLQMLLSQQRELWRQVTERDCLPPRLPTARQHAPPVVQGTIPGRPAASPRERSDRVKGRANGRTLATAEDAGALQRLHGGPPLCPRRRRVHACCASSPPLGTTARCHRWLHRKTARLPDSTLRRISYRTGFEEVRKGNNCSRLSVQLLVPRCHRV